MGAYKWVLQISRQDRKKLICGILFSVIGVCMNFIAPVLYEHVIDDVFGAGKVDLLLPLVVGAFSCYLVRAGLIYVSSVLIEQSSQSSIKRLRTTLYDRLQRMDQRFYSRNRTGDLMMKLTGDLDWVRHFLNWIIPNTITQFLLFAGTLIVFLMKNPWMTAIALVLTPFTAVVTVKMRKVMRPVHDRVRAVSSRLNTVAQENISGNRVVKAFCREEFETERFDEVNNEYKAACMNSVRSWWKYGIYIESLSNCLTIVILLFGGLFVIWDTLTLGELTLFLSLAWGLNEPMRIIGIIINDQQRFMASVEKVMQVYYGDTDIKSPENAYVPEKPMGDIVLKDVSLKYSGQQILKNINFEAHPGETIGIMGPTGSGKTTITSLIDRFVDPTTGHVYIDGRDAREYDLNALRGMVGMAMQDVFLFSETIRKNLAYGNLDASDELVTRCAKDADADGFIRRTPDGYDTIVGERGVGLSGGQKQRISLSRALVYDTPILILDDTTSAVDMETEEHIQARLRARERKATTIIIAQRISSVRDADRIYIIEDGTVSEVGNHQELLAKKGYYYRIYNLQQGLTEDGGEQ